MRRVILPIMGVLVVFVACAFAAEIIPKRIHGINMKERAAPDTPQTGYVTVYANTSGALVSKNDAGTTVTLTSGSGDNTLDNAYDQGGAGSGKAIVADTGAVAISNTDADAAYLLSLDASPSGSAALGGLTITSGANSTQNSINIANSGTGYDVDGTSGTWYVTKGGAATFASVAATTLTGAMSPTSLSVGGAISAEGDLTLDDGSGASPSFIMRDEDNETITFSKVNSGYTTLTTQAADGVQVLTGNLKVGNGSPGTAAMDGEDFYAEGDVEIDGSVQLDGAVTAAGTLSVAGAITTTGTLALSENVTFTVAADEYMKLDADTTANTGTAGVLDLNVQSATNTHKAVSIVYQLEDGATQAYGIYSDVNDDTSGAEVIDLYHAVNSAGTNATTRGLVVAATIDDGYVATLGAAAQAVVVDATTTASTSTTGAIMDAAFRSATTASQAINIDVESDVAGGASEIVTGIHIQLDDDANTATDEIHGIEIDTDGNGTGIQHAVYVGGSAGIDAALYAANGYLRIGTGATEDQTLGDDDAFIEGVLEVDGSIYADGNIVGDGATEISGYVHDVTDVGATNPFTVTVAMCGETFYNSQANQTNLPEASTAIGCKLTFVCGHASNFDINPDDADVMLFAANAAGDMLRSATVGDTLTVQAIDATNWAVLSMYPAAGDWADAN